MLLQSEPVAVLVPRVDLETLLTFGVMGAVFLLSALWLRLHVTFALILAAICAPLVSGFGFPLRHLVEGSFGYFYLILILCAGLVFFGIWKEAGALEAIAQDLIRVFGGHPKILLSLLTVLLMLPGMFTGFGGVAVLTSGVLAAPILLRLGIPGPEAGAIIALSSMFGMVAPPVNFPALLIVDGINMPYAGFGLILSLLSFPLAFFSTLYLGARHARPISERERVGALPDGAAERASGFSRYVPFLFVGLLVVLTRAFPEVIPDLSTPLILMLGALLAALTGPRTVNFIRASGEALKGAGLQLIGVLLAVGMVVQTMTLTGVRGLLVIGSLSLPTGLLFIPIMIALPILGGVLTALGVSSVLAVPFALAFVEKDMIVTVAALSLIASLAEFTLPTAISGILSSHVIGETYGLLLRRALAPILVTAAVGILTMIFANPVARALSIGR